MTLIASCPLTHAGSPDRGAALGIDYGHDMTCTHGVSMAVRTLHAFGAQWTCVSFVRISRFSTPCRISSLNFFLFNDRPSPPTRALSLALSTCHLAFGIWRLTFDPLCCRSCLAFPLDVCPTADSWIEDRAFRPRSWSPSVFSAFPF